MPELTAPAAETPAAAPPAVTPAVSEWSDEVKGAADDYGLTDYLPAAIRTICPRRFAFWKRCAR